MKSYFLALVALMFVMGGVPTAHATVVRSLNLQQLVGQADQIVKAEVISKNTVEETSGMYVTYYTLKISDSLKGTSDAGDELVFKQVARGEFREGSKIIKQNFYFPEYEVGKTYLFFLPRAHAKTGLLAPVGLDQGVYNILVKNGVEVLPQLKGRQRMLMKDLGDSSASSKLLLKFKATQNDESYANFKELIKAAE